ncbi:MAG TPA: hypothetical protein VF519_03215 [Mycobacteriales bacterium]|jgi:hypothetical protein
MEPFETRVATTMRAAVADIMADDLATAVAARGTRQRRRAVATAAVAVAATIATITAVPMVRSGSSRPAPPAAAPTTTTAGPVAPAARHTLVDVTYVPRGYAFYNAGLQALPEGAGLMERISYAPPASGVAAARALIIVETMTGEGDPVTVEDYRGVERDPRLVRIGDREVVHVRNDLATHGLDLYTWTEEPGLVVTVDGRGDVTDAEVRRVIAGLRRRDAPPTLVTPYATGTRAHAQPWVAATVVDEHTVDVTFVANATGCRVLSDVTLDELPGEVVVTLRAAAPPGRPDEPCPERGVLARARVTLREPLGSRAVRDGTDGSASRPVSRG